MWSEKPPIMSGNVKQDVGAIRDYLFRMADSLSAISAEAERVQAGVSVSYDKNGRPVYSKDKEAEAAISTAKKQAAELHALILKTANEVIDYTDSKVEEYNGLYVARSEYGAFTENINTLITNTARGVVESYNYASLIESVQDSIGLVQSYMTDINGEIRRGIVLDPDTNTYVTGIAISQRLQFSGECDPADSNNPGDGFTYYYLNSGQTFGLYTSTGWQFWIDGYKRGWFNSQDGRLHVHFVVAENGLQIGSKWQMVTSPDESVFEIRYVED